MRDGSFIPRAQRLVPREPLVVEITLADDRMLRARLGDISQSGMACLVEGDGPLPEPGERAKRIRLVSNDQVQALASAVISRLERVWVASEPTDTHVLGVQFDQPQPALITSLLDLLAPSPYSTDGLGDLA